VAFGCIRFSPAFDSDDVLAVSWRYWLDHISLQTISIPYRCCDQSAAFLHELRRVFSAAVRTAYANAVSNGVSLKQKELRNLVSGVSSAVPPMRGFFIAQHSKGWT
jgi:hypothetical protein